MPLLMRRLSTALLAALLLVLAALFGAGEWLTRPARANVGAPPEWLQAKTVRLATASGGMVVGWFAPGSAQAGSVLLLHGVRSDRRQMLGRASLLRRAGYAVLLLDLPAHGESSGDRISFGLREAEGVEAALKFLRVRWPDRPVGVIAVSLGAASMVLAKPAVRPDAVILESMYPTMAEAVADRLSMRLGAFGAAMAPALLMQLPMRLGISPDALRPIDALSSLGAPLLIVSGTADRHTTQAETERLFSSAQQPKQLWLVPGAAHVDLRAFGGADYERRVLDFLRSAMPEVRRPR